MRTHLQPFCTTDDCNRSCHQVHRRNQKPSPPSASISAEFLKNKRNLLRQKSYSSGNGTETKPEPMLTNSHNSETVCRRSLSTPKRVVTLEEIIELAKRKTSGDCEKPLSQKHYVTADDDDGELPVEEPAIQASELVKDNELNNDYWSYLEQLMELDADRISPRT